MNLRNTFAIAWKDFLDALRNARLLVIILMPVGFSVLYGYIFRDTPNSLELVVYTPQSSAFVEQLTDMDGVSLFVVDSEEAVRQTLESESAALGVVLPDDFDSRLQAGNRPQVTFIYPDDLESSRGAQRVVLQVFELISGRDPVVQLDLQPLNPPSESEVAQEDGDGLSSLLQEIDILTFFIILWVMMGVTMNGSFLVPTLVVEEKEKKTLEAMLVTPASYLDVVGGKILVGMSYCLLTAFVVMALNQGFVGDVWASIIIVVLASACLTLIGLLIGSVIDNLTALNTWASFIMLPLLLPGILAALPLNLPGVLQTIFRAIPTYNIVRGLALSLTGRGAQIWLSAAILAVETVILLAAVFWFIRRRER
ncbi:MAG: ABC transporter permease [Anaerolineales bacterium]|jgi:ABC-2 type transport system permease protein